MKAVYVFVLSGGAEWANIDRGCFMTGYYLELGCAPVLYEDSSNCPVAFKCPDLHPDPTMCYYRGTKYRNYAAIPQIQTLASCSHGCSCMVIGTTPQIECASMDCVVPFEGSDQTCVTTFELDSCCSTGTVCENAIAELKTCDVDGETYYEGQQIEPINSGQTCICSADWNDNQENSTLCRDINCGLELHHQNEIMEKCAPIFYMDGRRICPNGFQCPTNTSTIIRGLNTRKKETECVFGDKLLWVTDEVLFDEKCLVCKCKIPPFVSCSKNNNCYVY